MRVRLLHASECGLDAPIRGLANLSAPVREVLRDASCAAFDALVELALDRHVDAVLLAGGTYDGPRRGIRAQQVFSAGVEKLAAVGIEVIVVSSDDDPGSPVWTAIGSWPDRVHIVAPGEQRSIPITRRAKQVAVVHARSAPKRGTGTDLSNPRPSVDGVPQIVLSADPPATSLDDPTVAYWALGTTPIASTGVVGTSQWGRPGTIQGRQTTSDHLGPKGALIVDIDGGVAQPAEFVPLHSVAIVEAELDASACSALSEIVVGLTDAGPAPSDAAATIVVPVVTGAGPLVELLATSAPARQRVVESLRVDADISPVVWWDRVRVRPLDRTDPHQDSSEFSGLLVDRAAALATNRSTLTDDWLDDMAPDVLALVGSSADADADADWDAAVSAALRLLSKNS